MCRTVSTEPIPMQMSTVPNLTLISVPIRWFLPPANEVCEGYVFTGVCLSTPGCVGGHVVLFRGCMVLFGGRAWFYLGGMHGFIWGACMVLFGGHAWFYSGGVHGFSGGVWFFWGACMVFSVFSDTMRYGQWAGGTHPTGMHSCLSNFHSDFASDWPLESVPVELFCIISEYESA